MKLLSTLALVVTATALFACSGDDASTESSNRSPSTSGGTSTPSPGATSTTGTPSGTPPAGGCSGDITSCTVGTLSDAQYGDMCSLLLTAIESPPGTVFECKEGPSSGMTLTINDKNTCVAQRPPSTCSAKVGDLVACYKAAKVDLCDALTPTGACTKAPGAEGCAPK